MRLFVAIGLPDAVRSSLGAVIERLRPSAPTEKWVPASNLHATVAFLGEVPDDRVPAIEDATRAAVASLAAIPTSTAGAGAFPSPRRARVLWVGLADEHGRLRAAATAVMAVLDPLGFAPEKRPWAAHVTLARLRSPRDVTSLLAGAAIPSQSFTVDAITLYRSRLARPSPAYEPVAVLPLAG